MNSLLLERAEDVHKTEGCSNKDDQGKGWILCDSMLCLGSLLCGKNLEEAKKDLKQALELHLPVLKEKAIEAVTQ